MKIGIIKEGKTPPDSRIPMAPQTIKSINGRSDVKIVVAPSPNRCFKDNEFESLGIPLESDLNDCEVLMGVKEVPIDQLIANKTYFFFSHTIKKQAYNQKLLQAVVDKNITLIDYEVLTNEKGARLIAFGRFAGMVGAHNALWTYAQRTKTFELARMKDCFDYEEAKKGYASIKFPTIKIIITGGGRVANGAAEVLRDMGIKEVNKKDYLTKQFEEAVFTQVDTLDYILAKNGKDYAVEDFYKNPLDYVCAFQSFWTKSDVMINGIYWDNKAPAFFTLEDMKRDDFNIQVIADVTCDIAPVSSIPSTLKASTIADPVFGFDPKSSAIVEPYDLKCIDMMTIDNLPNEMPRDASEAFGKMFNKYILNELLDNESQVIQRATIVQNGKLGPFFQYLKGYVEESALTK